MRLNRTTLSIIIAAAVLLSAYGVGLLIRQTRTGGRTQPQPQPTVIGRAGQSTPEQRAKIQEAKIAEMKASRTATPEQKEQFKKDVIRQATLPAARDPNAPLDEKAAQRAITMQRVQSQTKQSPVTQDANRARTTPSPKAGGGVPTPDVNRPK
jgi:hypothetical protein